MLFLDLIFALLVAGVLALLFVPILGWRRRDGGEGAFLTFFLIVFLVSWAGGLWMAPVGPAPYGTPLLGFLLIGFTAAIVLAAVTPPPPRGESARLVTGPEDDPRVYTEPVFNWFFWLLFAFTLFAILAAYV